MNPLIPAFIHMDVKYANNAGAFICLPRGEKELWGVTIEITNPDPANVVLDSGLRRNDAI